MWLHRRAVFGAAIGSMAASYCLLGRRWLMGWGATAQERDSPLPGDGLIGDTNLTATRAITVRAAPQEVWPWIAQLGQGRGGFYSYDFLENVAGCQIHSANRVVAQWQQVTVGDEIKLAPKIGLAVTVLIPGQALVLRGGIDVGRAPAPYDFTWSFVVQDHGKGLTRLLVRERYSYTRWSAHLIVEPTQVVSFLMSQKMLRGIRDRAEQIGGSVGPKVFSRTWLG